MKNIFPEPILNLPKAKMPVQACTGFLFQGEKQQIIFLNVSQDTAIPVHTHAAQWEVVLEGKVELEIDGEKHSYTKGESFYIPENAPHSVNITAGYAAIVLFDQPDRYVPMD